MSRHASRREFLQTTSALGVAWWVGNHNTPVFSQSPNEKIQIASIGVGGKGSSDCDQAGSIGTMVALCDIDDNFLNSKGERFPKAKKYNDFRKMLDEMGKSIDAVTVSTPDHTHAPASLMAMRMGKHVYCQKPLTHSVYEARLMRETAEKMKVVTQMGNQGTAENGLRRAVELIRAGIIGPVREVHVWTNRPVWPQAPQIVERPAPSPVPAHVHWDLFLGPAQERPYSGPATGRGTYHDFNWRGWWDFGTGALGDMACHTANMAYMALNLGLPTSVSAVSRDLNPETFPSMASITYLFPPRGDMPAVKFMWYEGKREDGSKNLPPKELLDKVLPEGQKLADSGSLLVGDKGLLFSPNDYGAAYTIFGEEKEKINPPETLARNGGGDHGMKQEWIAGILGGPKPFSSFDYAANFTEAMLLGNVAVRVGEEIHYDGSKGEVTNTTAAAKFLKRDYRKGWEL